MAAVVSISLVGVTLELKRNLSSTIVSLLSLFESCSRLYISTKTEHFSFKVAVVYVYQGI